MKYIVQKNVFREENYDKIFSAIKRLGLDYEEVECPPFVEELEFKTEREDIFCFGSVKMARLALKNDWTPGSFFGGNHDYEIYSQFYKDNLLNSDSKVINYQDEIIWKSNEMKFIRPCQDSKLFTGRVFSKMKWEDLVKESLIPYLRQDNVVTHFNGLVQVCSPKVIYKEARVWIVGGGVVTSSYYKFIGDVTYFDEVEQEGLEFAKRMVDIYQVADSFVMDICDTPDGWKIVEINCINCSGFYKGDLQKLIMALEDRYN